MTHTFRRRSPSTREPYRMLASSSVWELSGMFTSSTFYSEQAMDGPTERAFYETMIW